MSQFLLQATPFLCIQANKNYLNKKHRELHRRRFFLFFEDRNWWKKMYFACSWMLTVCKQAMIITKILQCIFLCWLIGWSLLPRLASRPWCATDWWTKTQNMNTTYETKYLYCTACTTCTACTVSVLSVAHHGLLASLGNSGMFLKEWL